MGDVDAFCYRTSEGDDVIVLARFVMFAAAVLAAVCLLLAVRVAADGEWLFSVLFLMYAGCNSVSAHVMWTVQS